VPNSTVESEPNPRSFDLKPVLLLHLGHPFEWGFNICGVAGALINMNGSVGMISGHVNGGIVYCHMQLCRIPYELPVQLNNKFLPRPKLLL
jgi:hypothetical protein